MAKFTPRDWPLSWRIAVLLNISLYNMMGNVFASGLSPLFGALVMDLGCTFDEVSLLPGYALLALGLANVYALPLCAYIGKRYTILITMTIFLGVGLWSGWATSYKSLVATRFVGGLAAGVVEAMGPFIVSETFHEHQLGRAMVIYVSLLAAGSAIGPIFSGIIITQLGSWRWFFWIMSAVIGVNLFFAFILLPETSFAEEWEHNETTDDNYSRKQEDSASTNIEDAEHALPNQPSYSEIRLWKERSFFLPWRMADITRPQKNRFGVIGLLVAPFTMLLIPSVLISTILFGLTIACTVIYAILSGNILGTPPHLWTPQNIGLIAISSLIGLLVGLPVGGVASDMLSQRQARRSHGDHNPRSRLPLLFLGFLISPTGLLISGYSLRPDHFSWVGFGVGWGMLSFGLTSSSNIVTTYCVDTFRTKSGHIGVLINVVKNCIGFGVSYATMPWFKSQGPVNLFGTMAGLLWASYLAVIPLYFYHRQITEFSEKLLAKLKI